jgi:cytochrome P450
LTWTLLLLSQHPSIAADLLDELSGELHGAPPTIEQIAKLPLLDRVAKESLRLMPPVPLNHRILAETAVLGGITIPAGTEVFVSIYHLHHDPALFPRPEKFDPDRWLTINPTAFEYNPFSAGPRMCIGAPFAQLEIKAVLATLLQRCRLEFIPGTKLDRRVRITMAPLQGLPMMVRPQDRQFARGVGGMRGNVRDMVAWPQA